MLFPVTLLLLQGTIISTSWVLSSKTHTSLAPFGYLFPLFLLFLFPHYLCPHTAVALLYAWWSCREKGAFPCTTDCWADTEEIRVSPK